MKKKNWFLVIIIIFAVLLIAIVIWIYSKKIQNIENKIQGSPTSIRAKLSRPTKAPSGGKAFTQE